MYSFYIQISLAFGWFSVSDLKVLIVLNVPDPSDPGPPPLRMGLPPVLASALYYDSSSPPWTPQTDIVACPSLCLWSCALDEPLGPRVQLCLQPLILALSFSVHNWTS